MQQNSVGFFLLELIVVCALISIFMVLVGAHSRFMNRIVIRAELEKLHTVCRYLQQSAIVCNSDQELIFDEATQSYSYGGHEEKLALPVLFGFLSGIKGPPANPVGTITHPITFANRRIRFAPTGVLQPGTVYLVDRSKQYMYALSIPVAQVSYLRKYQYNGSWHLLS